MRRPPPTRRGIAAIELALAVYFLFTVVYSFESENYLTSPFLMIFFTGFLYGSVFSLLPAPVLRESR